MAKRIEKIYLRSIAAFLYVVPRCARVAWQAVSISECFYSSRLLILLSLVVEAVLFYLLIKKVTPARAFYMSLVGNIVSFLAVIYFMPIALLAVESIVAFELGIHVKVWQFVNWILMYLGSVAIELGAIKICFQYTARQLLVPVLVGNFVTYFLTFIYQYFILKTL